MVPLGPDIPISTILKSAPDTGEKIRRSPRLYDDDRKQLRYLIEDESSIIFHLADLQLKITRLSFIRDDEQAVARLNGALDSLVKP